MLAMSGVDVLGKVLPAFVDLLLYGPTSGARGVSNGSSPGAPPSEQQRRRLAAWRQQRQQTLLQVHQLLDGLPDPLDALRGFAERLMEEGPGSGQAAAPHPPPQLEGALASAACSAALQAARARAVAAQQLLVLLAVLQRSGSLGSEPMTAQQADVIDSQLLPALASHLQANAMALWLCKTPASTATAGNASGRGGAGTGLTGRNGTQPLVAGLRLMQLNGAAPQRSQQQPASSGRGAAHSDTPLAMHVLPAFLQSAPARQAAAGGLGGLGAALAAYVAAGPPIDAAAAQSAPSHEGITQRALRLGYHLFAVREYTQLSGLVALCGPAAASDAGLQFLSGVGLAFRLRSLSGKASEEERQQLLEAASGHLFRASAGLAAPAGAPLRQFLRQQQQQRGGQGVEGGVFEAPELQAGQEVPREAEARLKLAFFDLVVQLFQQEGCPEGAAAFSRAALGQLDAAYGLRAGASERTQHEGRLWSSLFTNACELGDWQGAYEAAISNPLPPEALSCVKRLVHALVDSAQLAVLCSLPWAGELARPGATSGAAAAQDGDEDMAEADSPPASPSTAAAAAAAAPAARKGWVAVADVVVEVLTQRSLASELSAAPQPYQVLYDFLVTRSAYKPAAAAMLGYAKRMRAEARNTPAMVEQIKTAYAACTTMLEVLRPEDQWLDLGIEPLLRDFAPRGRTLPDPPTCPPTDDGPGGAPGNRDAWLNWLASLDPLPPIPVVDLRDVQREAALFDAAAAVSSRSASADPLRAPPSPDLLYDQLLAQGSFDQALLLAHTLWEGQQLTQGMERLVRALATAAVRLQARGRDAGAQQPSGRPAAPTRSALLQPGSSDGLSYLSSPAASAWQRLRLTVERYDGGAAEQHHGVLRVAAASAILAEQPRMQLPHWLLGLLGSPPLPTPAHAGGAPAVAYGTWAGTPADPVALLRLYIQHGRLEHAVALVVEYLSAWATTNPLVRTKPGQPDLYVPVRTINELRGALAAAAQHARQAGTDSGMRDVKRAERALQQLDQAWRKHEEQLARDVGDARQRGLSDQAAGAVPRLMFAMS